MQYPGSVDESLTPIPHGSRFLAAAPPPLMDVQDGLQMSAVSQQNDIEMDFWDPSVLASTNWLDALDDCDFGGFNMPNLPLSHIHGAQIVTGAAPAVPAVWNAPMTPSHYQPGPSSANTRRVDASISSPSTSTHAETSSLTGSSMHDQDSPKSGRYYVDGGPARLPRTRRRKQSTLPAIQRHQSASRFSLTCVAPPDLSGSDMVTIDAEGHGVLQSWYERVCTNTQGVWPVFESVELPPAPILNHLVHLYFLHFHPVLPFIHRATFPIIPPDPVLALTMAAVASAYLPECLNSASFTHSLLEFARRITLCQEESGETHTNPRNLARVRLLLTVGLLYSSQSGLSKAGIAHARLLKEIHQVAEGEYNLAGTPDGQNHNSIEFRWILWCRREEAIRLAHSAWLVDCMGKFHFRLQPSLRIADTHLPLPCPEDLWNAQTAEQWAEIETRPGESKSLTDALSELYIDKRLPRGRGEFSRIIMIHGLFHRFWEVETYHSNPMSGWEPTAERQSSAEMLQRDGFWLSDIQKKWINSSCDSLDVLHWQANATIGQASGLEHSTVLHLHLARIVLLVPYAEILSFAKAWSSGDRLESPERERIRRWAVQHQYKARLAVVHAGVVFWHVRRYSIDAFYEAPAVGLATLTLWAFSTFAAQSTKPSSPSSDDGSETDMCNIILLDRPTDDELVQQFIRHDRPFQAHLTGVEDLYGAKGPQRVLLQGCKLLSSLRCWGVNVSWLAVLQSVSSAYSKE